MEPGGGKRFDVHIGPSGPLGGYLALPPSKNYTTRMILAAALAEGESLIRRPALNDDATALIRCCRSLGAAIEEQGKDLAIRGVGGRPKNPGTLNPANAGAVLRLLLGVAALVEGEVRFETDYAQSLGRRPNRELLAALRELGIQAEGTGEEATLPITIARGRARGGPVRVDCSRSSQFLSSLLFLAPHLEGTTKIEVTGPEGRSNLVSRPLIDQTLEVLAAFGARIEAAEDRLTFTIEGGQRLAGGEHEVNGDWPSAAALMSAVAVAGGMAGLAGAREDAQGERRVREALEAMGCEFRAGEPGQLFIHGQGRLAAIEFDGDLATDAVLALEAAACLAEGTSRFFNIANLKIKETDRIATPLLELEKLGIQARSGEDWVEITGRPQGLEGGIEVDCHDDHRIAQMLAILATRCEQGLTLLGADCVSKSYPGFFDDLHRLGVKVRHVAPAARA